MVIGPVLHWISETQPGAQSSCGTRGPGSSPSGLLQDVRRGLDRRAPRSHRLLGDRALVIGAACWLAAVLALYGVLAWLIDTPIPRYVLCSVAILAVPLARPSAALLALAWNRHR